SFFAALSLLFIVFLGDFEQGILAIIFLVVLLYFYVILQSPRKIITKKLLFLLLLIPLLTALFGLPYFAQIVYSLLHGAASSLYTVNIISEISWSNSVLGFLIPSYYNPIYNPIIRGGSPNFLSSFYALTFNGTVVVSSGQAITQDERTSYIGYLVLFLFLCGIYYDLKKKRYARVMLWLDLFLF